MRIPIFEQEVKDNIHVKVADCHSLSYISLIQPTATFDLKENVLQHLKACDCTKEDSTFDLAYHKSILVSTIWNANDDYFDPAEVWPARYSAKAKPLNIEHEQDDIIGHMLGSYAIDNDGNKIADDTPIDKLPEKYHIVDNSVIYRWWRDEKKREKIEELVSKVNEGEIYVSVETLFTNFDYTLLASDGTLKIVQRNKQTSFLTKYLKAYEGSGVYQDYKIGRVPRNLTFSGKGIVKKPANIENDKILSVILSSEDLGYLKINQGENMENEKQVVELTKTLESANASVKVLSEKNVGLEKTLNESVKLLEEAKAGMATLEKVKGEYETKYKEVTAELAKKNEELAKVYAEKTKATRVTLIAKLNLENADKFVDTLATLNDEQFASHVETLAALKPAKIDGSTLDAIAAANKDKAKEPTLSLDHKDGVDKRKDVQESISKLIEKVRSGK